MNCIHEPLLSGEDSFALLDLIPPPELHLMLGTVNKIFDELNTSWGENKAFKFAADQHIMRAGYQGGGMEGNQCKMLLNKIDSLQKLLPAELVKFADTLQKFNAVRLACFGEHLLPTFKEDIQQFQVAYTSLWISVTPKVHAIFHHVSEFCQARGVGLGRFSEQASESVHSDFAKTWQRYVVPHSHAKFGQHLLQAVQSSLVVYTLRLKTLCKSSTR